MAAFHFLLSSRGNRFITEIGELYASALNSAGHPASLRFDQLPDPSSPEVFQIVVAPQEYYTLFLKSQFSDAEIPRLMAPVFCLTLDQPGSHFFEESHRLAALSRGILDINASAAEEAQQRGQRGVFLPLPFHLMVEKDMAPWESRPIDFLFMGSDSPRRERFFSQHAHDLEKLHGQIRFACHGRPVNPGNACYLDGASRTALLRQTKLLLNLHAKSRPYIEWHRILTSAAAGTLCLTEPADHYGPLLPGEDLPIAEIEDMPGTLKSLLRQPAECAQRIDRIRAKLLDAFGRPEPFRDLPETLSEWEPAPSPSWNIPLPEATARANNPLRNQIVFPLAFTASDSVTAIESGSFRMEAESGQLLALHLPGYQSFLPGAFFLRLSLKSSQPLTVELQLRQGWYETDGIETDTIPLGLCNREQTFDCPLELSGQTSALSLQFDGPPATRISILSAELHRHPATLPLAELHHRIEKIEHSLAEFSENSLRRSSLLSRRQTADLLEALGHTAQEEANAAVSANPPAISVVIPLYNYARHIGEALDSVAPAAAYLDPNSLEILVVDDCSTDASAAVVRDWMRQTALPLRLLAQPVNLGLAAARNRGLKAARGQYVFFLDADNRLLPHGLERLLLAIQSDQATAAYGILSSFRNSEDIPEKKRPLLSLFAWDAEELVRGPYIDAMALFDRQQLLSLGGYDETMQLEAAPGWEDYELWLRLASAGSPVSFVPHLVGEYRLHQSSMMGAVFEHQPTIVRYLKKKHQSLWNRFPHITQPFGEGPPVR